MPTASIHAGSSASSFMAGHGIIEETTRSDEAVSAKEQKESSSVKDVKDVESVQAVQKTGLTIVEPETFDEMSFVQIGLILLR